MKKLVISIIFTFLVSPAAFGGSSSSFCGEISELSFTTHLGRVYAHAVLLNLQDAVSSTEVQKKLIVTDPKVVFKLAKGVSQASVQNPQQLQQDLKNSRFYWNSTVSDEEHPYPQTENFEACLKADLNKLNEKNELNQVIEILDLKEDGFSIIDLMN